MRRKIHVPTYKCEFMECDDEVQDIFHLFGECKNKEIIEIKKARNKPTIGSKNKNPKTYPSNKIIIKKTKINKIDFLLFEEISS